MDSGDSTSPSADACERTTRTKRVYATPVLVGETVNGNTEAAKPAVYIETLNGDSGPAS